jgi:deoxyribodipyrimidine photo-lyase
MVTPVILWFRNDLRLNDNPALHAAAATGAPIIPLYIFDDAHMGAASKWWLHHSLKSLDAPIVTRKGDALKILRDIIKETGATQVFWNRLYEPNAIVRDTKIKSALDNAQSFKGNILIEPWDIKPYKVFTPFYKACLERENIFGDVLGIPHKIKWAAVPSDDLDLLPRIPWDKRFDWTPGENGAHARAQHFIEDIMPGYKTGRDYPAKDDTSRLSPHLHFGEISVRELWFMAAPHTGARDFMRELAWREFSMHLLYHNPKMPTQPLQVKFEKFPWQRNKTHLRAWQRGLTGYPIVDAGMRQLWQTGWMHNRVRMIVGSFLVKHLLQPWQDGEAWFWDCLVDADLANNAASWQWIAGCGADAAPYFRVFNPILQGDKFDPTGAYVRNFVPELKDVPDKFIHKPWESGLKLDYPAPIIDHAAGRVRALEAFASIKGA